MLITILACAALAAWVAVLLVPWQPHRVRERLEAVEDRPRLDDVTVLIPARNEAAVIERTLAALFQQGPGLEIIVVDDESGDGTGDVCRRFAARQASRKHSNESVTDAAAYREDSERNAARAHATAEMHDVASNPSQAEDRPLPVELRVVDGRPRPAGWSGKLWALQQALESAKRPHLLLLDADIELEPGTIAALVEQSRRSGADAVSIMATLRCSTFAEKLLAPPFVFFFKLLYPFALANTPGSRVAAAAGGCIFVRASALAAIGGFEPLRGALIDDCTLAATLKRGGHRIWIGMSHSVRSLRAYSFRDFWRMVSRTAFTQLRYSGGLLAATTAAMLIVFVAPIAALFSGSGTAAAAGAAGLAAMAAAYLPMVRFYRLPAAWALTLPAAGALFLGMTWDSALRYWRGVRAEWKDRAYSTAE